MRFVLFNAHTLRPVNQLLELARPGGKPISVRASSQAVAALEILEAWGFSVEPCPCGDSADGPCPDCARDAEDHTEAGRL